MAGKSGNAWALARRASVGLAALASVGVAGCGNKDFDNSFNTSFDKSTHDSCVPSAVQHGAPPDGAERYCTCVVKELDKLSVQQKMSLSPTSPEISNAASACVGQLTASPAPDSGAPANPLMNSAQP
jgi:hypothetical protein